MRLPSLPVPTEGIGELPLWPPLLATRGPGGKSAMHAHHAMHLVLGIEGEIRARASSKDSWIEAAGVLTAPDATHAIDASDTEVLLVFLDPESDVGGALAPKTGPTIRIISRDERAALVEHADPLAIMLSDGATWIGHAAKVLGAHQVPARRRVHPRVRKALRLLHGQRVATSLEALAHSVGLSPGRLMHAFTESIGTPLRPYLAWLKLQRAAGAVVSGMPLAHAAHAAGFADASHMSRTFRRMFGVPPSSLRPEQAARVR